MINEITHNKMRPTSNGFGKLTFSEKMEQATREAQNARRKSFPDIVLHRSALNDLPLVIGLLTVTALVLWSTYIYRANGHTLLGRDPFIALAFFIAIVYAWAALAIVYKRFNVKFLIASDGIQALRGFLSNHQVDAKLEYYQIRGTEIHRTFLERLVGTGNLVVRGSSSQDTEVAFKGIRDPYRFQKLIQARHRLEVQGSKAAWINDNAAMTLRKHVVPKH